MGTKREGGDAGPEKSSSAAGQSSARIIYKDTLLEFGSSILQAGGTTEDQARMVMDELIAADLAGHSSHGAMRLIQYISLMKDSLINPGVSLEIVQESPVVGVFDGQFGFGQCIMRELLSIASRRARQQGTYTAFCRNCAHIGRLGSYTRDAARDGFLAMMVANVCGARRVAPFGGIDARMGTNPISIATPWEEDAIYVDTTTCSTAEGKIKIALQNGTLVPDGVMIDNQGNPSTDPVDFYSTPPGAILPLGGTLGYKGSGLAAMIDVVGGILSGMGFGRADVGFGTNGVWLYLVDLGQIIDSDLYRDQIGRFVTYLKDGRTAAGVEEILVPGEPERNRATRAEMEGIRIPAGTWHQLSQLATELGVAVPKLDK